MMPETVSERVTSLYTHSSNKEATKAKIASCLEKLANVPGADLKVMGWGKEFSFGYAKFRAYTLAEETLASRAVCLYLERVNDRYEVKMW
jgi:hypothetical protein